MERDLTAVKEIATCEQCEKFLETPVTLPCLKTICESHIKEMQPTPEKSLIEECSFCKKSHEIPLDGFEQNLKIKNLIESNIHLNQEEKQLKTHLESLIRKLTRLINNLDKKEDEAVKRVEERVKEIKEQIESATRDLKRKIDELSISLLKKLNEFEAKCKNLIRKVNKSSNNQNDLNDLSTKCNEKKREVDISEEKTKDLKIKIETKIEEVEYQLKEFEKIKILASKMIYKPCQEITLNDYILGELEEKGKFKVITGGQHESIKIWDIDNGLEASFNEHTNIVFSFAISTNGQLLASGLSDGSIKIWDTFSQSLKKVLKKFSGAVYSLLFNGELLISGCDNGTIKIWDKNWLVLKSFKEHNSCVNRLISLPYNEIASGSDDCTIKIWNLLTKTCVKTINNGTCVSCLIITIDQASLISGDIKGMLKIWDMASCTRTRTLGAHIAGINSFEVTKQGEWLISADTGGSIKVWSLKNFECIKVLESHTSKILLLKSLDNNQLISCSRNNVIKIWDLNFFDCVKTFHVDHIPGITCAYILFNE